MPKNYIQPGHITAKTTIIISIYSTFNNLDCSPSLRTFTGSTAIPVRTSSPTGRRHFPLKTFKVIKIILLEKLVCSRSHYVVKIQTTKESVLRNGGVVLI